VKNINSFNFVKRAIDFEVARQTAILEKGETPMQENRGWNEARQETVSQRSKEEAADYRYFPDPDIPPLRWTKSYITLLAGNIPELPGVKEARFLKNYGLPAADAGQLVETKMRADFFEEAAKAAIVAKTGISAKEIANWIINRDVDVAQTLPAVLLKRMQEAKVSVEMNAGELEAVVAVVLKENAKAKSDYKAGREQALMFLLGQVQRKLKGKAPVPKALELLKKKAGS
jgi:aspartyl-tRNA(Asn)/glutamyl-tRNA(Gln) amidotransferase subunit B